jgi:ADP-heptose:LPS heptosyltransferase
MLNVDRVRKIDYWVGIPLCFLSTLLLKLLGLFSGSGSERKLAKVLFIELSEMGSAILVDPAMRWIRDEKHTELFFVIFKRNIASLQLLNTVPNENIFTIRDNGLVPLAIDSLRFLFWARRHQIDTVIDLELFSRFTALLTGFSGAVRRVGFYAFHHEGLYRGSLLTHRVSYNPHIHTAKNFLALVHAAASPVLEVPFTKKHFSNEDVKLERATVSQKSQQEMITRVRGVAPSFDPAKNRIVLINPNASELLPLRRWMPEKYTKLIQYILEAAPDVHVLITGAPSESGGAEALRQSVNNPRCHSFAGKTSFIELPWLYEISTLMVTNDSGPAHFASVTRMPTFVLFGPETPRLYGALGDTTPITAELACSPCVAATNHRKTSCKDPVCLKVISPEHVFSVLKPRLMERVASPVTS